MYIGSPSIDQQGYMIKCWGGSKLRSTCCHDSALILHWRGLPIPPQWLCPKKEGIDEFAFGLRDFIFCVCVFPFSQSKNQVHRRGEYNVYSTFQSHEPEFDYLKSLEIEEKINKIRWLPQQNAAYFLLSTNGTCRWLCPFGICRDTISKLYFNLSWAQFFFLPCQLLKNFQTVFARCLPECLAQGRPSVQSTYPF